MSTGECVERKGEPLWRCGVSKWKGRDSNVSDALKDMYIHTRYIEWDEWDIVKKEDAPKVEVVEGPGAPEAPAKPKTPEEPKAPKAPEDSRAPGEQ